MALHEETSGPGPGRVLEDPSGARRRRLRLLGRAIAVVAFAWLAVVLLGGIGVGPASHLPFGHALRASSGPPPLRTLPAPTPPSPADLRPALPEPVVPTAAPVPNAAASSRVQGHAHGRKPARPQTATVQRGRSANAPGQVAKTTATTHGRSASAPGRARKAAATTTTTATTTAATTTTVSTTNPAGHLIQRKRGHTR